MDDNNIIDTNEIRLRQDPIFIVGCPRSGTTLLQALLATQDGLYSLIETHYFNLAIKNIRTDENCCIEESSIDAIFVKLKIFMGVEISEYCRNYCKSLAHEKSLDVKKLFEIIIYPYLARQSENIENIRWIEKTPSHFHSMGYILSLYPAAKFLCIIRHPIPVVLSRKNNIAVDSKLPINNLAQQWNTMIAIVEKFNEKHPDNLLVIKYEDLVGDIFKVMSSVAAYLHIELDKEKLKLFGKMGSQFILPWEKWKESVTSGAIKNTNLNWINNARIMDILKIQMINGPYMVKYNYDLSRRKIFWAYKYFERIWRSLRNL